MASLSLFKKIGAFSACSKKRMQNSSTTSSEQAPSEPKPLKWQGGRAISGHAAVSAFTATLGIEALKYFSENRDDLNGSIQKSALIFSTIATLGAMGCSLSRVHDEANYASQALAGSMLGVMAARH